IVGIVTLLSKTVTTRLFDTENQDYPNSLENFEDYEFNSDVGDGFGWLELEQKALYLSKQATYDDNEDYEKYESVRGTPMRINHHQGSKYCVEKTGETIKLVGTPNENVFPSEIQNITCLPSDGKSNKPHSVRCKSNKHNQCGPLYKAVPVFRQNKNSGMCWKRVKETVIVGIGCRCF
ncbi:hypothetical protein MTP99_005982, partial [Tenebrio molitor]